MLSVSSLPEEHHLPTCRLPFRPLSNNAVLDSSTSRGQAITLSATATATASTASFMAISSTTRARVAPSTKAGSQGQAQAQAQTHGTAGAESVAQALEFARESPEEAAADPTTGDILEDALARTWAKITAQPGSYVMTRDEFAVFNFFQDRFVGNEVATEARKRYWSNTSG